MEDNICPRCKNKDTKITKYSEGEVVCVECGYVFETEFIDEHNEERFFSKNCSTNGISNKNLSRTTAAPSTYYFGNIEDNNQLLGRKKKLNNENNTNYNNKNLINEKEKKILKKNAQLNKIDLELRRICDFFNISKMIYEATKEDAIKLYEYGKIHINSHQKSKLPLGLLLNWNLKNKTNSCFSKEEIANYFECNFRNIDDEGAKIYDILLNINTISMENNQKENLEINEENKLNNYLCELQKSISFLIKRTKINKITGICDSCNIAYLYATSKIFDLEVIPPIGLAGGSMIFCIKLYDIQFLLSNKSKERSDENYSMTNKEEEKKLICYIAKKCGTGVKPDKLRTVYEKMRKYKKVLENNDRYKDYLVNLYKYENE